MCCLSRAEMFHVAYHSDDQPGCLTEFARIGCKELAHGVLIGEVALGQSGIDDAHRRVLRGIGARKTAPAQDGNLHGAEVVVAPCRFPSCAGAGRESAWCGSSRRWGWDSRRWA